MKVIVPIFSFHPLKILFLSMVLVFWGCDRGKANENLPPDTKLAIDSINLIGSNRLNSIVQMSWYGTDRDGYVVGYDISIDSISTPDGGTNYNWKRTFKQDSTFNFSIPEGQDTTDIKLRVRSIDNLSLIHI